MNKKTLQTLEFDKILCMVKKYAVSLTTHQKIEEITPVKDKAKALDSLQLLNEAYAVYFKYTQRPITEFFDTREIAEKAKADAILSPSELLKAARLLRAGRIAKTAVSACGSDVEKLKNIVNTYMCAEELEKEIFFAILSDNEINDRASSALYDIRRKLVSANLKLRDKLSSYARMGETSKYLQDNIVTLRAGRYVLPVKSECRSSVPGLIHDKSSTGSTVFIEPYAVVEMNNEIRSLQIDETAEIERILLNLTRKTAECYHTIFAMQDALTSLDLIFAKLMFCTQFNCTPPTFGKRINLVAARHPLIDKNKIIPVDICMHQDKRLVIITGPNTGGKTVSLKTVGLFAIMAASGFWIPAGEGSEIPLFDEVFPDIGDEQSIESSLSTFSSHITNIIKITNNLTSNSLVLFDELGAGTDPDEGAALAIGILKYLEKANCTGIITTHYSELKEYALVSNNISIAGMQFNSVSLTPTYKLIMDMPGSSNALKIAASLGMNKEILDKAHAAMAQEKIELDKLLSSAEEIKNQSLAEYNKLSSEQQRVSALRATLEQEHKKLLSERERISASARAEVRRIVSGSVDLADNLIEEIKQKLKQADESALLEARKIRNKIEDYKYKFTKDDDGITYEDISEKELTEGARVFIKTLMTEGVIVSVNHKKGTAKVKAGAAAADIPFSNLAKPFKNNNSQKSGHQENAKKAKKPISNINNTLSLEQEEGNEQELLRKEIDVRGNTVFEAVEILEKVILEMHNSSGGKGLRIIHGKGTGALGKGIQEYLKSERMVKSFRYGKYGEGDNGVTIATIR